MDIQIILTCYLMLNIVASNLGLKHAIPITEEHEVVPPSDFKLTGWVLTLEQARSGHPNTKVSLCQEKRISYNRKIYINNRRVTHIYSIHLNHR
jgi:hypothetical protein